MFKSIPWDVWTAAALAVVVLLAIIFEPGPAVLIVGYTLICAYIVVETINGAQC
jgi:hypothetical protein